MSLSTSRPKVYVLADGVTTAGAQPAVPLRPGMIEMLAAISIVGGTAWSARVEVAFDAAGPWIPVGTARTAIGEYIEKVPAAVWARLNITTNTGSTIGAKVYA